MVSALNKIRADFFDKNVYTNCMKVAEGNTISSSDRLFGLGNFCLASDGYYYCSST
jgi:hypothetical protein